MILTLIKKKDWLIAISVFVLHRPYILAYKYKWPNGTFIYFLSSCLSRLRHLNTLFQNHSMYKHKSEGKTVKLLSTGNILTLFVVSVRWVRLMIVYFLSFCLHSNSVIKYKSKHWLTENNHPLSYGMSR